MVLPQTCRKEGLCPTDLTDQLGSWHQKVSIWHQETDWCKRLCERSSLREINTPLKLVRFFFWFAFLFCQWLKKLQYFTTTILKYWCFSDVCRYRAWRARFLVLWLLVGLSRWFILTYWKLNLQTSIREQKTLVPSFSWNLASGCILGFFGGLFFCFWHRTLHFLTE